MVWPRALQGEGMVPASRHLVLPELGVLHASHLASCRINLFGVLGSTTLCKTIFRSPGEEI